MGTLFVDKLDPQSGTSLEIGSSGDTMTVPSGATFNVAGTLQSGGAALGNTPFFYANMSGSDQTGVSSNTWTKVQFNNEVYDPQSVYDPSSNYRFTPNVAGKYLINARISPYVAGVKFRAGFVAVYKNGSSVGQFGMSGDSTYIDYMLQPINQIVTANGSSDYFEIYGKITTSDDSNGQFSSGANTQLSAFKVIE
jgi:hypothetical protein